jgi:integral membrane protein
MTFIENLFSKYPQEKLIKWFKQICIAEAFSWMLLFSAMVWIRSQPDSLPPTIYIIIVGNIHGLFFSLYLLLTIPSRKIFQWDDEDFVFALISAFFPMATIWIEKKLARFDRE